MLTEAEFMLAQMANPYFHYSHKVDPNVCFDFIQSNKISLLLKRNGLIIKQAEEDEKNLSRLLNELVEIKKIFDSQDVKFVLIKLPKLPRPHGDLDILLIKNINSAEDILKKKGYAIVNDADPYRRTYIKEINGERLEVDFHLEAAWGGIVYLEKEEIWNNRVVRKINDVDIPVPCPEHELLIAAAHGMRENKITLFDVLHVAHIFSENEINMEFVRAVAKENNWLNQLQYFVSVINEIYYSLYGSPITENPIPNFKFGNTKRLKIDLPFNLPFYISFKLKSQKMFSDLIHFGVGNAVHDLRSYYSDISVFLRGVRK